VIGAKEVSRRPIGLTGLPTNNSQEGFFECSRRGASRRQDGWRNIAISLIDRGSEC